jgi:hypothetical protein
MARPGESRDPLFRGTSGCEVGPGLRRGAIFLRSAGEVRVDCAARVFSSK